MREVTTDELRQEYRRAHLWRTGMSLREALDAPAVRKGLELAARAHRRPQQPQQGRLFSWNAT